MLDVKDNEYLVSARKYRPLTFDAVVGQEGLTATLKNAVRSGKLAHAYLFCGPRGVGKTTCARIFAKAINCSNPTAEGDACGQCESCKAFNERRSMNIFELDGASNNSVENIKSLMEQTRIPPQTGRYKVFIIDEVHMLSQAAFNAFLKTLEEPPAHVIFILATTEKNKILPTIISRCQIYDFARMSVADIIKHLTNIADKEGVTCEEEALAVIAEKADGGMRDALSLFDQAALYCKGNITYAKIIENLNIPDSDNYFKMLDYCYAGQARDAMLLLNDLIAKGFDPGKLMLGLAKHVRNVLMAQNAQTARLIEASETTQKKYAAQAAQCNIKFLYAALKLLSDCDINYRPSNNKRLLVELTLIQISQLTDGDDGNPAGRSPATLKPIFEKEKNAPVEPATTQTSGTARPTADTAQTGKEEKTAVTTPSPTNEKETATGQTAGTTQPSTGTAGISTGTAQPSTGTTGTISGTTGMNDTTARKKDINVSHNVVTNGQRRAKRGLPVTASFESFKDADAGTGLTSSAAAGNDTTAKEDAPFSNDDLKRCWDAFCGSLPEEKIGIVRRMRSLTPVITTFPAVEITVDNALLKDSMSKYIGEAADNMRTTLHNSAITVTVRVEAQSGQTAALSPRELFEKMTKDNSAVEKLRDAFDLEFS